MTGASIERWKDTCTHMRSLPFERHKKSGPSMSQRDRPRTEPSPTALRKNQSCWLLTSNINMFKKWKMVASREWQCTKPPFHIVSGFGVQKPAKSKIYLRRVLYKNILKSHETDHFKNVNQDPNFQNLIIKSIFTFLLETKHWKNRSTCLLVLDSQKDNFRRHMAS